MSKWKNASGQWYTVALFYDTCDHPEYTAKYVLSFEDKIHKGHTYLGFYRLYLELEDPTEYEVAMTLFGGLDHWERIVNSSLRDEIEKCRAWLAMKLKSKGMKKIIEQAPENFQAAKYLAEETWLPKAQKAKVRRSMTASKKVVDIHTADVERVFGKTE